MPSYRAAALLLVVTLAGPVRAGQSSACTVLTDPAGDARASAVLGAGGQLDASLDLLSASFEGDASVLHVRLQVGRPDNGLVGRAWTVTFADGESQYALVANQQADGNAFDAFGPGAYGGGSSAHSLPPLATISGSIDLARGLITFDAPLKALRLTGRARFQDFEASSGRAVGTTGGLLTGTPLGDKSSALSQSTTVVSDQGSGVRNYRIDRGCRPFS